MNNKVTVEVEIYEVDGEEVSLGKRSKLTVSSHWNRHNMVVLKRGHKEITVSADDLADAIRRAEGR